MRLLNSTLSLLLAGSMSACFAGPDSKTDSETQLIGGHVPLANYSAQIVGVRVVAQGKTVAKAKTDHAGNFNIRVPQGRDYAFQVVTKTGSHTLLTGPLQDENPLSFDVCSPGEDFDLGDVDPLDFEEIDGDTVPWTDSDDDCSIPDWLCGAPSPDGEEQDPALGTECFDEPESCEDPEANPEFCWDEPILCSEPEADPAFCLEEPELPSPCQDNPDLEECETIDDPCLLAPDACHPGDDEPLPEEPWDPCLESGDCEPLECEDDSNDPFCVIEVEECDFAPDGSFSCEEDIGAAPEFPLPDFGCEDLEPADDFDPALEPEGDLVPAPEL